MESEPLSVSLFILQSITTNPISIGVIVAFIVVLILLISSALISGSEVAYFSITPKNLNDLKEKNNSKSKIVLKLLSNPEKLLATILITKQGCDSVLLF